MKRMIMAITALLTMTLSASAMSYEQARREALFLTDKMAYELNLTDQQYEAAYEINLDYLMGVTSRDDVYGDYWTQRNLDFSYILLDWQWKSFCAATYFYRPLYWSAGYWHFGIYARYPRRDYFYFNRPVVYVSYRGGHSWRSNGGRSYYQGRKGNFHTGTANHSGMRDRWNNGDTRRTTGNGRNSSTRVTVNNGNNGSNNRGNTGTRPGTSPSTGSSTGSSTGGNRTGGSFGGNRNTTTTGSTRRTTTTTTSGTMRTTRPTSSIRSAATSSSVRTVKSSTLPSKTVTATPSTRTVRSTTTPSVRSSGSKTSGGSGSKTSGGFGGRR